MIWNMLSDAIATMTLTDWIGALFFVTVIVVVVARFLWLVCK